MGKHRQVQEDSDDYSDDQEQQQKVKICKPKIERIDKFKNLKKIVINVSMTQYPVVSEVAEQLGWKIQESNDAGDWDIYWTDFAIDPDILIKMHLFQKINHYPGIHVIARKNLLGLSLMGLRNKFPDQYNFFPLTWMLPLQYAEFRAYYQTKPKGKARTYIAKPQADCQGRGIFLTRKIQDFQNGKHYVVQRYLARPYLLEGLKFDLRIYVLLCGTNPLRLYMYNQGLARLATEQYTEPNSSNLQKQYIHLTNYAINKNNPKFVFNNSSNNMGVGHKRSITSVYKLLAEKGVDIEQLKQKINDVAIKTIICGLPLMSHQYKCSQPQDYSGSMCFHILGLDVMLNNKAQPILLEVNHTPSFTTDTPLDQKIKFNLIKDSLKLMNINVQTKNQLYNRAKDLNKQRLLTGKRQIFEGKQRENAIQEAQRLRQEYQANNIGGFQKIFPLKDQNLMKKYDQIIDQANRIYLQQNGSIRSKMMEKQAKKLIRSDFKQMKIDKEIKQDKLKMKQAQIENASQKSMNATVKSVLNRSTIQPQKYFQSREDQRNSLIQSRQEESIVQQCALTKSEANTPSINKQISFIPDLIKKYSDKTAPTKERKNQSIIKIKKYEPHSVDINHRQETKDSRISTEHKNTPNRRIGFKQQLSSGNQISNTHSTPNQRERLKSNTVARPILRKQNTGNTHQLPNIIENIIANNDISSILRREQNIRGIIKQNGRGQNKSGKIYEYIAKDIRQIIEKKTANNGGYVMPKLINLNFENQRRFTQNPPNFQPFRKGNIISQQLNNE